VLFDIDGRQLLNTRMPFGAPLPAQRISDITGQMRRYGPDRTYVSNLFLVPHLNQYNFVVQVPVRSEGRVRYLLTMGVGAASMQALVREQGFPREWLVSIVDRDNNIVARSIDVEQHRGHPVTDYALRAFATGPEGTFPSISLGGLPVQA